MLLPDLFADLATRLQSADFLQSARHPEHPTAFTRRRKLPLPCVVALMLTGMRKSIQAELDTFFGHLQQQAQLVRHVSEQAFALARSKLSLTAIPQLNDWLIERAYVHTALKPLLPALLLGKKVANLLRNLLRLVAKHTYRHRENVSKPRKAGPKPHKPMTQKHRQPQEKSLTSVDWVRTAPRARFIRRSGGMAGSLAALDAEAAAWRGRMRWKGGWLEQNSSSFLR